MSVLRSCDRQKPYLYVLSSSAAVEQTREVLAQVQGAGVNLIYEEGLEDQSAGPLRAKTAQFLKGAGCKAVLLFLDRAAVVSNRILKTLRYSDGAQVRKSHNRAPLTLMCVDYEAVQGLQDLESSVLVDDEAAELLSGPACSQAMAPYLEDALHYDFQDQPGEDWYEGLIQQLRFLCPEVFCITAGEADSEEELPADFDPTQFDNILAQQSEAALRQYQAAALQGDAGAQMQLGFFYEMGYGCEADPVMAANWYRKAAEQDNASAQYSLGELYYRGDGLERNLEEAAKWFRKAAAQGNRNAQAYLSELYFAGNGVPQDYAKSARWAERAAEQGDAKSQFLIGWMYEQGRGVTKDEAQAARWYRKAADNGNTDAMCNLAVLYSSGRGVIADEALAIEWFRKAADQDHPTAQYALGMYYAAAGDHQDPKSAFKWYQKAAQGGHPNAWVRLGSAYEAGEGTEQNYDKARDCYQKAADLGDPEGQYSLGITWYLGHGVTQDYLQALACIQTAAQEGLSAAQAQLGYMLQAGEGVGEPDPAAAVEWFQKAADQNNVTAIRNLAAMYEKGVGVEQDKKQAVELYTRASRLAALGWE